MNDWGKFGRRYEMCLKEIAKRKLFKRVILVTPPTHFSVEKPFFSKLLLKLHKLVIPFEINQLDHNIVHLQPVYSFIRPRWVEVFSLELFLFYLKLALFFQKTVFVAYPFQYMIGRIIEWKCVKRIVSDIVDDYTEADFKDYPKERRNRVLHQYQNLIEKSDVIYTTSQGLSKKFQTFKQKIIYLPNGVDPSFITGIDVSTVDNHAGAPPVAGYIGFIDYRINFKLIERLLCCYPELTFAFYGPILSLFEKNVTDLVNNYDNFKYRGVLTYGNVKDTIASFKIGIVPHKIHNFVASMSPLKLYQFIGQGKPVVVMDNAIDSDLAELIYATQDENQFISNIKKAISEVDVTLKQRRVNYAIKNTWEQRVDSMLNELGKII